MTTNDERAAVLGRAIVATITGDVSEVEDLFTRDVVGTTPAVTVSSREELAIELEEREDAFTEIEVLLRPLDVAGDQACVEWVASARHSGSLVFGEDAEAVVIPATGRRLTLSAVTVAEFDGLQISSFRHYWDEVALLVGLGLLGEA